MRPLSLAILAALLTAAAPAHAVVVLDTGTPDESGAQGVYYDPTFGSASFVAQEFTLVQMTHLSGIEVFAGGSASNGLRLQVTSDLGPAADAVADVLGATDVTLPGTPNFGTTGEWRFGAIDLMLAPGSYFLVVSPALFGNPFLGSSYLPTDAPMVLGDRFVASDGMNPLDDVDLSDPILSDFGLDNSFQPGFRFHAVPEPMRALLVGAILLLPLRRRAL